MRGADTPVGANPVPDANIEGCCERDACVDRSHGLAGGGVGPPKRCVGLPTFVPIRLTPRWMKRYTYPCGRNVDERKGA